MAGYLSTLPLFRYFWTCRDIAMVSGIGVFPFGLALYPLAKFRLVSLWSGLIIAVCYLALLALLRLPQLHGGRQSVLLSTILVSLWAWLVLTIVNELYAAF